MRLAARSVIQTALDVSHSPRTPRIGSASDSAASTMAPATSVRPAACTTRPPLRARQNTAATFPFSKSALKLPEYKLWPRRGPNALIFDSRNNDVSGRCSRKAFTAGRCSSKISTRVVIRLRVLQIVHSPAHTLRILSRLDDQLIAVAFEHSPLEISRNPDEMKPCLLEQP